MAITNAAAGDFIIRKKRNKESVERQRTTFHISAFRFQLCAFDPQSRPAKIEA